MNKTLTAVYEKRDNWYIGYVKEAPGVNTQGRTLGEVKRNLKEALELIVSARRHFARSAFIAGL